MVVCVRVLIIKFNKIEMSLYICVWILINLFYVCLINVGKFNMLIWMLFGLFYCSIKMILNYINVIVCIFIMRIIDFVWWKKWLEYIVFVKLLIINCFC